MPDMFSLERVARLGQIKGMCYEPTPSDVTQRGVAPNCYDPNNCRDFDMDYFNSDFADLWGTTGRNDLGNIQSQNVNLMRLYNWTGNESGGDPLRNHIPYLDYCQKLGLGTMVPFSNYNATISPQNAQNSASSIVNELANSGALHPAVKMWQPTNEFELTLTDPYHPIKPEDVARLVEYLVRAEEAAGITADENKVPIVVGVSTGIMYGAPAQSLGQVEALRMAFITGGTLPDGTVVQGNDFLTSRSVWVRRFVIGVQSFQFLDEIEKFVILMQQTYKNEVPIILTEHGYDSVNAARLSGPPFPGNGGTHDVANQARIVAQQIAHANDIYKAPYAGNIFRGMCFFQWLNTYYKCGKQDKPYDNTCTEANFGEVEWNDFGAPQPTPSKTGTTGRGQSYPIDDAIQKTDVYQAVTKGFGPG
jgi:hypothetical protein